MWDYPRRVYNQEDSAQRFQLEYEIATCSPGIKSIQEYYHGFVNKLTEVQDISTTKSIQEMTKV